MLLKSVIANFGVWPILDLICLNDFHVTDVKVVLFRLLRGTQRFN